MNSAGGSTIDLAARSTVAWAFDLAVDLAIDLAVDLNFDLARLSSRFSCRLAVDSACDQEHVKRFEHVVEIALAPQQTRNRHQKGSAAWGRMKFPCFILVCTGLDYVCICNASLPYRSGSDGVNLVLNCPKHAWESLGIFVQHIK